MFHVTPPQKETKEIVLKKREWKWLSCNKTKKLFAISPQKEKVKVTWRSKCGDQTEEGAHLQFVKKGPWEVDSVLEMCFNLIQIFDLINIFIVNIWKVSWRPRCNNCKKKNGTPFFFSNSDKEKHIHNQSTDNFQLRSN